MAIKFSNLASTTLASGVSSTATSVSVTSASSFPTLGSGDYFYATIGAGSGSEIVKVTAISGTTFTVSRGEDGTTAVSHSAGVDVALRVTAGTLEDLRDGGQVYTAGSGLGLSGNEFTNTAPDQTVSISGSGSTTVTGTYPSFTVSSTSYSHPSAHPISFITGLQTALDGKVDDSQVLTNVPSGALFTDTVYTLPFTDNSTNWNTAYGWGDHSTGGYLTSHQSLSGYATETYVGTQISNLVDSSPAALNTLNELAAALGDDANFSTTVTNSIATKLPLAGGTLTGTLAMGANAITSTGTISSGAITSTGIITSADFFKATGQNIKFSAGGTHVLNMDVNRKIYPATNNSTDLGHSGTLAFRTLYLTSGIYHNTSQILDSSRNLLNIGTISSGAITSTGLTVNSGTANVVASFISTDATAGIKLQDNSGNVELSASGSTFNVQPSGGVSHFSVSTNVSGTGSGGAFIPSGKRLGFDQSGVRSWTQYATGGNLLFASGDGNGAIQANNFTASTYAIGTNTVIDASRNLTNIGTISSGAITSTGATSSFGPGSGATYIRIGDQVTDNNPGGWNKGVHLNSLNHGRFRIRTTNYTYGALETYYWADSSVTPSMGIYGNTSTFKFTGSITTLQNSSGNTFFHAGNDGSGSGLDADLLDGIDSNRVVFGTNTSKVYRWDGNWNTMFTTVNTGFIDNASGTNGNPDGFTHHHGFQVRHDNMSNAWGFQLMGSYHPSYQSLYHRNVNAGTWSAWKEIWDSGNDGSGSGLDADLLDGVESSGYVKTDGSNPAFVKVPPYYTGDLNGISNAGVYFTEATGSVSNNPFSSSGSFLQFGDAGGVDVRLQFYAKSSKDKIAFRNQWGNGSWGGWHEFWTTQNDGSGSGLDADLLDGQHGSYYMPASTTTIAQSHYVSGNAFSTNGPDSVLEYAQAASITDTKIAPSGDWYNSIRMGHGDPYSYYSNTMAMKMTGSGSGTLYTQVIGNNSAGGWNKYWHTNNDGSGSGLDADTVDGIQGASFLRSDTATTGTTITASDAFRSERWEDGGGTFLFRKGATSGRTRHLNLADTTGDPSSVTDAQNPSGISWGQRGDNNGYYMLGLKGAYNNGYSTYSRLVVGWHTGLEIGANPSYGGTRFFSDSPYVTSTEIMSVGKGDSNVRVSNNLFCNGVTETPKVFLNGGAYEGQIIFGSTSSWRCGIRQHDDGDAELRIWAKHPNGRVHIATGYDGEPASISRPTDGFVVDNNRVGIGNFAGSDPSTKLHVKGETTFAGAANTTFATPNLMSYGSSNSAGVANYHIRFVANNGNSNGSISTNYYQTTYATTSDYRVKEDLQPMLNSTSRLMSLNPVNFQWKDSDMRTDGFLAHEVAEVVTDAVVGEKDAVDEQGNDELQSLDQSKLVPLLVKTIQEQQSVIEALEGRISALEA